MAFCDYRSAYNSDLPCHYACWVDCTSRRTGLLLESELPVKSGPEVNHLNVFIQRNVQIFVVSRKERKRPRARIGSSCHCSAPIDPQTITLHYRYYCACARSYAAHRRVARHTNSYAALPIVSDALWKREMSRRSCERLPCRRGSTSAVTEPESKAAREHAQQTKSYECRGGERERSAWKVCCKMSMPSLCRHHSHVPQSVCLSSCLSSCPIAEITSRRMAEAAASHTQTWNVSSRLRLPQSVISPTEGAGRLRRRKAALLLRVRKLCWRRGRRQHKHTREQLSARQPCTAQPAGHTASIYHPIILSAFTGRHRNGRGEAGGGDALRRAAAAKYRILAHPPNSRMKPAAQPPVAPAEPEEIYTLAGATAAAADAEKTRTGRKAVVAVCHSSRLGAAPQQLKSCCPVRQRRLQLCNEWPPQPEAKPSQNQPSMEKHCIRHEAAKPPS